jgi:AcrR family transcriptional regulator
MGMPQERLTADDWAAAALRAIGERGLAGVAVEPLAVRLGTTKGSFYWHFANRDALIEAALRRWEETHTASVIRLLEETGSDPSARLRLLYSTISAAGAAGGMALEANLLVAAGHPLVEPVLRRVVGRRLAYVEKIFEDLGLPPVEARHRALIAYAGYVGSVQLAERLPGTIPTQPPEASEFLDATVSLLLGG